MSLSQYPFLPRRPVCGQKWFHAESRNNLREDFAELRITIPYQEPGWFLVREGVSQLLSGPLCRGMCSHVEVNDSSSIVRKEDKHIEQLGGDGWNNEEVQGDDFRGVVLQERFPALAGCSLRSRRHVSLHGGFRDI